MYNLAKLLIDEPHKLERLIILFLKLLLTLHVTGLILGYNLSVGAIIDNPIPKSASSIQIIYFFVIVIAVWFIIWNVICQILLYDVLIGLLSNIGSDRAFFIGMMQFLGVVEEKNKKLYSKSNIISFTDKLDELNKEKTFEVVQSRLKEYFLLTTIAYIVLIISYKKVHLTSVEVVLGAFVFLNLLLGCIAFTKISVYMAYNIDLIKREFQPLAYAEKIVRVMAEISQFENYERPLSGARRKYTLKRKSSYDKLPELLTIIPVFHWNQSFSQKYILQLLLDRKQKQISQNRCEIVVTNTEINDEIASAVKSQNQLVYIYATTNTDIFHGLEEWIQLTLKKPNTTTPSP
jgi:hypothetical protein